MKSINKFAVLLTVALGLAASSCYGDLFDLSYTFDSSSYGSGTVVTGTFDGTANGNLINNVSNLSLYFDGSSFGAIFYSRSTEGTGPAVVSLNGAQNDFVFAGTAGDMFVSDTGVHTSNDIIALDLASESLAFGEINLSDWSVVAAANPASSSVPEGGATIALLGLGLVGLAGLRRGLRRI